MRKALTNETKQIIIKMLTKNISPVDVALEVGCSEATAYKIRRENGIKQDTALIKLNRRKKVKVTGKNQGKKVKSIWRYGDKRIEVTGVIDKSYEKSHLLIIDQQSQKAILSGGFYESCERIVVKKKDTKVIA